jgi:hypothetical protein
LPTVTVTVVALAGFGQKARTGAMIATNTAIRIDKVFMTAISYRIVATNLIPHASEQK